MSFRNFVFHSGGQIKYGQMTIVLQEIRHGSENV